jgi:hypothetical protein
MGEAKPLIRSTSLRWPDPSEGPYSLRVSVAAIDGKPEVVGVELWGADPARFQRTAQKIPAPTGDSPISATTIRLPLQRILQRVLADFSHESDLISAAPKASKDLRASVQSSQARLEAAPVRAGRPPLYGLAHYTQVANVYSEAIHRGRHPIQAVMERWTVNKRTAVGWVERARKKDLLPPTTQGRARA